MEPNINNNNMGNNEGKQKDKKKGTIVKIVIGSITGFVLLIVILNILFPNTVATCANTIEDFIKNICGVSCDINGDGCGSAVAYKPVIYIYSKEDNQDVAVKLETVDDVFCEYPKRNEDNTWVVKADMDGVIRDANGLEYNYLFWESKNNRVSWDFSKGFCVKGTESREFLDKALEEIGLTRREANEFIVYWLPKLEANEYNLISFQDELYKERYKLSIEPSTSNVLRVYMTYKKLDEYVEIEEQDLSKIKGNFKREGLHIVEWGGSDIY